MDPDGRGGGKKEGGLEEVETLTRINYVRKWLCSITKKKNKRNCTLKMASTTVTLWVTTWVDFDICIKGISYQIQLEKATSNFGHNIESNWRTERSGQIHFLNRNGGQDGNVLLLFWWISMCIVVGTVTQERTTRLLPEENWEVEQVNTRC